MPMDGGRDNSGPASPWQHQVHPQYTLTLGAHHLGNGRTSFEVWAPRADSVELEIVAPHSRVLPMTRGEHGYCHVIADDVHPGTRYFYRLNGKTSRPDPVSRHQPDGVHQASEVIDSRFEWTDEHWPGLPLSHYILYELHVGTFTSEGTFDAVIPHLDRLVDLGITAIEIMPVAQFPGSRNWGYDGVHLFAPQSTYGGPLGLKRLVNACHARGLAVVMDVVYNHFGPEGNYISEFGHYFTGRHHTPWGEALNFDGPHSDEVRRFFLENALSWLVEYHIDALRLDAVHAIYDQSARPFLRELADAVREQGEHLNRRTYSIAESNLNDPRLVSPKELGGAQMDGQWIDDFHHSLHHMLTGERTGYYADFVGFEKFATSYRDGFVFTGQYSCYRGRRHGTSPRDIPAERFVVCAQNHDQVGNRMLGERISQLVSFEQQKLAAGAMLLSPYIPLLFMGEEYGETAPFQFFVSHLDPGLVDAVRRGRREEFASFRWMGEAPDPQDEGTFLRSRLNHALRDTPGHATLFTFYKTLIALRKSVAALALLDKDQMEVQTFFREQVLAVRRWTLHDETLALLHFRDVPAELSLPLPAGTWTLRLDSADVHWRGPGSTLVPSIDSQGDVALTLAPQSVALYTRELTS